MSSLFQLPTWGPTQQCNKPSYCCILQNLFPSPWQVEEKVLALAALLCHSHPWKVTWLMHIFHTCKHDHPFSFTCQSTASSVSVGLQWQWKLFICAGSAKQKYFVWRAFSHGWIFDIIWNMSMFRTFHKMLHKNIITMTAYSCLQKAFLRETCSWFSAASGSLCCLVATFLLFCLDVPQSQWVWSHHRPRPLFLWSPPLPCDLVGYEASCCRRCCRQNDLQREQELTVPFNL